MSCCNDSRRARAAFALGLICVAVVVTSAPPAPSAGGVFAIDQVSACVGDCDGTNTVIVTELITLVNIALDTAIVTACMAGDANGDAAITIDEIIRAVNAALEGCPMLPTPSVTRTPTGAS